MGNAECASRGILKRKKVGIKMNGIFDFFL